MLLRKPAFAYRHDGAKHDAVPGTRGDGFIAKQLRWKNWRRATELHSTLIPLR